MSDRVIASTALTGRSRSANDQLAKGLGWFSIGLGIAEVLAAKTLARSLALEDQETLIRAYGAREVATGVAILASHDPAPWIWGRVIGDALDLATLAFAGQRTEDRRRGNVALAVVAVAAVTVLDVVCARGLEAEKGGRTTAVADYGDRTGFPRAASFMRGAARNFEVPSDMRVPDLLRADVFARRTAGTRDPATL